MRGNTKVMRVPTTLSRKVRLPQDASIQGISELLHSITPNERRKTTIHYLKNSSPPIPIIYPSAEVITDRPLSSNIQLNLNHSEGKQDRSRFQLLSKALNRRPQKNKNQCVTEPGFIDLAQVPSEKEGSESPFSIQNLQNIKFFMMKSRIPVFRENSCFLMSKDEFQSKLPRLRQLEKKSNKISKSSAL